MLACVLVLAVSAAEGSPKSSSAGTTVSFAKAITFLTGVQCPLALAVGDLNGDGIPDLAVVSPEYSAVTYAFGKGNGKFGEWHYTISSYYPDFVLLADVNQDGNLDAISSGGNLTIAFGDGHGHFPTYEDINSVAPYDLKVVDLNGDKIPDIVGGGNGDSVAVLPGEGQGKFGQPAFFSTGGQGAYAVAVGDLNHDGIPDLVVANFMSDTLGVLLGKGGGRFGYPTVYATGDRPWTVVLGDFNGDGNLDVAATATTKSRVDVRLGNGDGTFSAAKGYPTGPGPFWIAAADFNGDGKLDLVMTESNYICVLLGNGDGTFQKPRRFRVGTNPWELVVADFNRDGKPDIATVNIGDGTVSVLLNTTPLSQSTDKTLFSGPSIKKSSVAREIIFGSVSKFMVHG
jgi:hypothetical protein